MSSQEEIKKLERRARAMLVSKEIPPHKQELVRTLMNNRHLKPYEKYRAIIELVHTCPDKKVVLYENEGVRPEPAKKKRAQPRTPDAMPAAPEVHAPTETSYYIDDLYREYRDRGLFRRRYLVHRNNKLGIGIRKRLVPSKKMMKIMAYLAGVQGEIAGRLVVIMMKILEDPAVEDPLIFNYLRCLRKWMSEAPLLQLKYEVVKWMERAQFERELKGWVTPYFSFLLLNADMREKIIAEAEARLRSIDDFRKEDLVDGEPPAYRRDKEKRNLEKEKLVYEFMMLLRSFVPLSAGQECLLSKRMKERFETGGLGEFMMAAEEALVFQRHVDQNTIVAHYGIKAPFVNNVEWDYSEDYLVKVGKDRESLMKKTRDAIRRELEPYETLAVLLRLDDEGRNMLLKGAEDQWRYIDKKHYDSKMMYNENFINFLDALLQCFRNMYVPLLDGSTVVFRDMGRQESEGAIFSLNYFEAHLDIFNRVLNDMHSFRTGNPTGAVGRDEVRRAMKAQAGSGTLVDRLIRSIGDCFYLFGKELQVVYDQHRRWAAGRPPGAGTEPARESLKARGLDESSGRGRPLPFYDCVILDVRNGSPLSKELAGKRVMEDSMLDGVFLRMNAFAYQVAHECMSERLARDLEERRKLLQKAEAAPDQGGVPH